MNDKTVPVTITVLRVDLAAPGRLVGLAAVALDVEGIVIELHGVRIVRTGPRSLGIEPPHFAGLPAPQGPPLSCPRS